MIIFTIEKCIIVLVNDSGGTLDAFMIACATTDFKRTENKIKTNLI